MKRTNIEIIITSISKLIPLSIREEEVLRNNLTAKKIKANEIIHSEGNICDFEAFIKKGILRTYYTIDGNERILNFFEENQWISDFKSFTLQEPSKITIQAIEDCELVLIKNSQMKLLSQQISNWDLLGKLFFKKLFIQNFNHLESLLISSPEERYADLLKNRTALINRIPQYFIAQYIGVQPESLSRIRKRIVAKVTS
ncbi:MAG: Crp/Fnr family transcriptional regulator [Flavobacteriales bacterium]|nr:Crp/Fnr family transcriptional regulator [Flavobacteriales bacterium]